MAWGPGRGRERGEMWLCPLYSQCRSPGMLQPLHPRGCSGICPWGCSWLCPLGLCLQLGPSPVITHGLVVFRGVPARDPWRDSGAGSRKSRGWRRSCGGAKEGKILCEAVLDVLGLRSPSEVSGTGQGAHTRVAQILCPQGCRDPFPSCPKGSYLTERENSPGALSLSRIRKAPRWLRWSSRSSARCREILPAYHLRGAPG